MSDTTNPIPFKDLSPGAQRDAAIAAMPKVDATGVKSMNDVVPPPPATPATEPVEMVSRHVTDPGGGRRLVGPLG